MSASKPRGNDTVLMVIGFGAVICAIAIAVHEMFGTTPDWQATEFACRGLLFRIESGGSLYNEEWDALRVCADLWARK